MFSYVLLRCIPSIFFKLLLVITPLLLAVPKLVQLACMGKSVRKMSLPE